MKNNFTKWVNEKVVPPVLKFVNFKEKIELLISLI